MADTKTETQAPKADAPAAKPAEAAAKATETVAAKAAPAIAKAAAPKAAKPAARRTKAKSKARKAATAAPRKNAVRKPAPRKPAARIVRTAATITTQTVNEGNRKMKNETKQAADRFQAAFGDVNERAKTAIERNTRVAEQMTELTKGNVEALVAATKVAAKGVETLGQEVAEFNRKSFEDASAALKGFAEVKSPTDFFRLQSEFARSQFDMVVAETSKLSETMIKLAGEVAQPITNRYSVAAERVRTAVAA